MSRSYKKTPYASDNSNTYMKKQFNRKLRHQSKIDPEDESTYLPNSSYKKANQFWDIKDYEEILTWDEYWQKCLSDWQDWTNRGYNEPYPNKEKEYNRWKKYYKQK